MVHDPPESEEGLQNMLNSLNTFAINNGLKANLDKTKVMIFNKNGRLIHKKFTLGGVEIQVTREYKYLGFKLTPSGEINSGLNDLKDRALRAYMKMKKKTRPSILQTPYNHIKIVRHTNQTHFTVRM